MASRAVKRVVSRLNSLFYTPVVSRLNALFSTPTERRGGVVTALVDCGCRFSRPEVETIAERAKSLDTDPVNIVNVYDRSYDSTQFNLSRKEAMLNFYVIDQQGRRHKNVDAILFLYWHADRKVYYALYPFYYPIKFVFERLWLPHRLKLYGRDDVLMEINGDKRYMEWVRSNTPKIKK